jgi:hypothetical protein
MRRSYRKIVAAAAFFPALSIAIPREIEARGKTHAVVGYLQRVEGDHVTLQTSKGVEVVTLVAGSEVRQGPAILEGSRLRSYVGQKIKVRYVENGGRKEVQTVTVPSTAKPSST